MKYFSIICLIGLLLAQRLHAQQVVVSGTVRDASNGELLIGAVVRDSLSLVGVGTNTYGFFSLSVPNTTTFLRISYVGYQTLDLSTKDLEVQVFPLDIRLSPHKNLEEVTIRDDNSTTRALGHISLPISRIKAIPSLLGEVDVMKALSLTPGVASGMEGSAGIYVRGGTPDQNLILLDEVPVYNATHLGGFFSVFNPNSLKSVDMYKGAFPARYGGRLASVIDLTMRDGNNQKFGGEASIGLINQNLTLEGPIIKNKASFIVSGRISTLGLTSLLGKKRPDEGYGEEYAYRFYDLNAKLNYQVSKKDHLFVSFYTGYDRFRYTTWVATEDLQAETILRNEWGNTTGTIRYSKILSPKVFARLAFLYSNYNSLFAMDMVESDLGTEQKSNSYRYINAGVTDYGTKFQVDYFPVSFLSLKAGIDLTRQVFRPFSRKTNYTGQNAPPLVGDSYDNRLMATRIDAYLDGDYSLTNKLYLNTGIRYSTYSTSEQSYLNPEPRLGLSWSLPHHFVAKGGYSIMNQYLHLLTNNGFGFGYDAWLPSVKDVVPSRARQTTVGLFKTLPKARLDISLEAYAKSMKNLIDYPDGTNFTGLLADSWDEIVVKGGVGRAKGIELMVNKTAGKFNGWASYTLSRSEIKFDEINQGKWYPATYDRRHMLSITGSYSLKTKWRLSGTFVYQTGHAVTLPDAAILTDGSFSPRFIYSTRNGGRMPEYHRLDVGATRFLKTKRGRNAEFNFGVYNAYNRKNPFFLEVNTTYGGPDFKPSATNIRQYSLFSVLPYISYSIKF